MSVINTNISATLAANAIRRNDRAMETAMERLSTGLRINSAKDDAAGLAVSTRMAAVVSGLQMASKNANDAISMLEVAEGATLEINNMLIRMRELAVQSASGTYSDTDREALNLEFGALIEEIDRIAKNTTWNTMSILDGGDATRVTSAAAKVTSLNIQLGPDASQVMTVELKSWVPSTAIDVQSDSKGTGANGVDPSVDTDNDGVFDADVATEKANNTAFGGGALFYGTAPGTAIDIKNSANSSHAITQLDKAILGASNERARYGAYMSRLEHSSDNLLNVAQNTDQSRSRIEDADYAIETSELARTQIISQAATAMLAQANQAKQNVLSLLQ
ncbi:flagellin [Gammaproteobacteria bacterium]|jgi:flagellin|nr:flagellin [Gammaproteobacteria bacterium]MDB4137446.1 flagellin [Gammaproteobacteria bacterium]MDC1232875.1 flagellin [Gammaproteobacteria bacterium]MDC1503440.1 flagellin [Gammaproteobacteria bacterium]